MSNDWSSSVEHATCIHVVGSSGSGKTLFARKLALFKRLGYIELDDINHLAGWTERSKESFRQELIERMTSAERKYGGWVLDGNYFSRAEDIYADRVDCVVWLDYKRRLIMRRLLFRSLFRVALRRSLWNGNKERLRSLLSLDPSRSILMWSWTNHEKLVSRYEGYANCLDGARWIRLKSPTEAEALLQEVSN